MKELNSQKLAFSQAPSISPWLLIVSLATLTVILVKYLTPYLIAQPDLSQIPRIFTIHHLRSCDPDPIRIARYFLAISVMPTGFFLGLALSQKGPFRSLNLGKIKIDSILICIVQIALILALFFSWRYQYQILKYAYFTTTSIWFALGGAAATIAVFYQLLKRDRVMPSSIRITWLPTVSAAILTVILIIPGVLNETNLKLIHPLTAAHFGHWLDEISAIVSQKTTLVDFFPLYENLLGYISLPFFKVFKFSIGTFTVWTSFLSGVATLSYYFVFRSLTQSSWSGFFLFLALIGIAFFPMARDPLYSSFSYNALWPFRYFFPSILSLIFCLVLATPTPFRLFLLGVITATTALNNLDFGIPAAIGVFVGLLLTQDRPFFCTPLETAKRVLRFIAGLVFFIFLFISFTWFRSGHTPRFDALFRYQKIFALYGFNTLPWSKAGIQIDIYLVYMAALLVAIYDSFTIQTKTAIDRKRIGLLAFSAIFGCGALAYYVNRTHPWTLAAQFIGWGFAWALLTEWVLAKIANEWQRTATVSMLWILPCFAVFFHYFIFVSELPRNLSTSVAERIRLNAHSEPSQAIDRKILFDFTQANTHPGEAVAVMLWDGFSISRELGIKNTFPFESKYSIIVKDQVTEVIEQIDSAGTQKIISDFPVSPTQFLELKEAMKMAGFAVAKRSSSNSDLQLWKKMIDH